MDLFWAVVVGVGCCWIVVSLFGVVVSGSGFILPGGGW